jgi:hypothetical protein
MAEEPERTFTLEEANAELPGLRESLKRIREARRTVLRSAGRVRERASTDGGGAEGKESWEALRVLREEVEGIVGRGIILRDPDTGLVDFPSRREGRVVHLCWRDEEDRIGFWHEVNAGFGGRKPL